MIIVVVELVDRRMYRWFNLSDCRNKLYIRPYLVNSGFNFTPMFYLSDHLMYWYNRLREFSIRS